MGFLLGSEAGSRAVDHFVDDEPDMVKVVPLIWAEALCTLSIFFETPKARARSRLS